MQTKERLNLNSDDDILFEDRIRSWLGTALLACASIMAILIFADRTNAELFSLPRLWYETRSLHLFVCLLMFVFAGILLKGAAKTESTDTQPHTVFQSVRFFTRQNCSLCDKALQTLQQFEGWIGAMEIIDIDGRPDLMRQFGESVPVVEINGRIRFRGAVDAALLQRLITGTLQQQNQTPLAGSHTADSAEYGARQ